MVIVIPAIKGKIGNTTYYEATMKVKEFVRTVTPPKEMDEWADFGIEERLQREPDIKRIETQLAPYIANNEDRFFGSVIVLIYKGTTYFDSIKDYVSNIPAAYRSSTQNLGFLTISGESFVVLDGQHRRIALEKICTHKIDGEFARDVANDDICVIFVQHQSNQKTRRIFNTVNRYAKQTSRGDNIITSEDDGYAIVSRRLLEEGAPFGQSADIVNWRSNTLTTRSTRLTTISALYETVKLILDFNGVAKLNEQARPTPEDLEKFQEHCNEIWHIMLERIDPYRLALKSPTLIPDFRKDNAKESLLFKPAAQIALVDGMLRAIKLGGISLNNAIDRINLIEDWSMSNAQWKGVIIKYSGTIDASQEARRRTATLICYLIASDHLSSDIKFDTWKTYNLAKGTNLDDMEILQIDKSELFDLPKPAKGVQYTVSDALHWYKTHVHPGDQLD